MKTIADIIESNIDDDVRELDAYRGSFIMHAALSRDAGYDSTCAAYMEAALLMEQCIQVVRTIPTTVRMN